MTNVHGFNVNLEFPKILTDPLDLITATISVANSLTSIFCKDFNSTERLILFSTLLASAKGKCLALKATCYASDFDRNFNIPFLNNPGPEPNDFGNLLSKSFVRFSTLKGGKVVHGVTASVGGLGGGHSPAPRVQGRSRFQGVSLPLCRQGKSAFSAYFR